jgi:membrane associated rhomboid family serine protease
MLEEKNAEEQLKATHRGPILTWLACAICVIVFSGLSGKGPLESWDSAAKWGYYPPGAEWDGKYWALLTSVFVHIELWHLAFNLYWLWFLGGRLEKAIGSIRWLAFFLTAAIISSGIQLGISGAGGIGASGVVYAIFGFMWAARNHFDAFRESLPKQTIVLFVAWLFICLVTTFLNIWQVGNAAHFSGMLFGIIVADIFVVRYKAGLAKIASVALVVASVVPLFWSPWSVLWVSKRAYNAHSKGDYVNAINFYYRSLELGQDPIWVYTNLAAAYRDIGDQAKHEEALKKLRQLEEKSSEQSPEPGIPNNR